MPDWKSEIETRLIGSRLGPASQYDLTEELAQHLDDRYQELLSAGTDEMAARTTILEELRQLKEATESLSRSRRNPTVESTITTATPSGNILVDVARDIRYGMRVLWKTPVLTFFAVVCLGLGIGANTTVFTMVNSLLLHPLPVMEPSRLITMYETADKSSNQGDVRLPLSYANFIDYAGNQNCCKGIAAFSAPVVMSWRTDARSERIFGQFATKEYFETLGLRPAIGRFFLPREDNKPGSEPVAVLSYNAWKSRFGGASDVIGRTLELNNIVFTVIGVAPEGFLGVSAVFGPDVWLPATMLERSFPSEYANALTDRAKTLFHIAARLNPGVRLSQAQAQLDTVSASLQREYSETNDGRGVSVRPITDELFSNVGGSAGLTFGSAVLFIIVVLVLGIACSNVANLLLARATARRREIAVRLAIGASRSRLMRQMLTESVLLSLVSCAAGLGIGYAGCRFVWSFVPAEVVQNMVAPKLDGIVLGFAVFVSLVTAFLFGLAPAVRASKTDLVAALKEETPSAGRGRRSVSFSNLLLVCQVAFSLVCLIVAGLFIRSIQRAYTINPGFETRRLALFMMDPGQAGYDETRVREFYRAAKERVSTVPGITAVSWASGLPFWSNPSRSIRIEGTEQRRKSDKITTVALTIDTGYFQTTRIPLLEGRAFVDGDTEGGLPVAIVNQTLAQAWWPRGAAVGHRLQFTGSKEWRQIIGVVASANYTALGETPQPCVYVPLRQNFVDGMILYVRSEGDPGGSLTAVQQEIRNLDKNIAISDVRTGAKLIDQVLFAPRIGVALLGVFGSLALALASVGLYGVMAYSVVQRRREIGVRMALGATRATILGLILRQGMALVACGIALGLAGALIVGSLISRMLFGINSADPVSLAAASLVLVSTALLACYFAARSASGIDPMVALRDT